MQLESGATVRFRRLGQFGPQVSIVGLGTNSFGWRADRETSIKIIKRAIDLGITFVDTANSYADGASETFLGEALASCRHQIVLATKVGMSVGDGLENTGCSRVHIMREIEGSLRRLKTDYIDLYQIHRFDSETPIEETIQALDDLVRQGKVKYIGCSNYAAWQVMKALHMSEAHGCARYISVQPAYSFIDRAVESELVPLCLDQGIGIIAYYPLAAGLLTGKYRRGTEHPEKSRAKTMPEVMKPILTSRNLEVAERFSGLAVHLGVRSSQLAIAWVIGRPGVSSALVGATEVSQLEENVGALDITVTQETHAQLDALALETGILQASL